MEDPAKRAEMPAMDFSIRAVTVYVTSNSPTEHDNSDSRSDGLSQDVVLTLLSHRHRRVVLDLLRAQDRPLTLRDLRNEIIEREHGTEITELDDEQANQPMVALYHVHIPKLAEAGVVTYDHDRKVVEPTEELEQMESFFSCVAEI